MNRNHFLIYFKENKMLSNTPKDWARENKHYFPKYDFSDNQSNIPITDEIVAFLENNFAFSTVADDSVAIHYNLNPNLKF